MTRKRTGKGLLPRLPKQVAAVRRNVETTARRAWNETLDMLPVGSRKAVKRFTHELDRAASQLQQRVKRARADFEARGERLVSNIAHRAEKTLTPVVHRLDVASRTDVDRLRKRVAALERRAERPMVGREPTALAS